jgi:hypothetical protein
LVITSWCWGSRQGEERISFMNEHIRLGSEQHGEGYSVEVEEKMIRISVVGGTTRWNRMEKKDDT